MTEDRGWQASEWWAIRASRSPALGAGAAPNKAKSSAWAARAGGGKTARSAAGVSSAKQSQFAAGHAVEGTDRRGPRRSGWGRDQARGTKPIFWPGPEQAGRSGLRMPPPLSRILRNKANSRRARITSSAFWKSSYGRTCPCSWLEKTKPIFHRRVETDAGRRGGEEAPTGEQPCKTKPICAGGRGSGRGWQDHVLHRRWAKRAKQSQFHARQDGLWNRGCNTPLPPIARPASGLCRANSAKQSQFGPAKSSGNLPSRKQLRHILLLRWFRKNKANFGGRRGTVDLESAAVCRREPDYASGEQILDERYRKPYLLRFRVVAGWHEVFPSNRKTLIL